MSIWRTVKATKGLDRAMQAPGKLGFGTDENIRLETAEDMAYVRALIHLVQDEPDKSRALVQAMSGRDRAVLSFYLKEMSRLLEDAEVSRWMGQDEEQRDNG